MGANLLCNSNRPVIHNQEATKRISASVHEFNAPFIILHGLEDKVTCPKVSEDFYKDSLSKDKDIRLYKGM